MIAKLRVYYYKNIKKYDYYTITVNGVIEDYVFTRRRR